MIFQFDDIFVKYQCEFRKGFSPQQCLIVLVQKWKKNRDKGGSFATILTDFSTAFDCFLHDLLTAELHAYGFDMVSPELIYIYLNGGKQRFKIYNKSSL